MFHVWETGPPARSIAQAGTLDEALEALDAQCRRWHEQAVADPGSARSHRVEIRDPDGEPAVWLMYTPDSSRPYESVRLDRLTGEVTP
jgi:hypothetical protein